jgi:hypothetical protein
MLSDESTSIPDPSVWMEYPCKYGHIILWSSGTTIDMNPPKGMTCQCGKFTADGKGGYENAK